MPQCYLINIIIHNLTKLTLIKWFLVTGIPLLRQGHVLHYKFFTSDRSTYVLEIMASPEAAILKSKMAATHLLCRNGDLRFIQER